LPDDGFVEAALAWAGVIAAKPRGAVVAAKRAIVDGMRLPLDDALRLEGRLFVGLQAGEDALALEHDALERYRTADPADRVEL